MRLRAALQDPALREKAARRYAQKAPLTSSSGGTLREQLEMSALRGMTVFAGNKDESGYLAIARFVGRLPEADREKAADIFMKILNGSLWELWQVAREKEGLHAVAADEKHGRFLQLSTNALADAFFYDAPVFLQLQGFDEVKASVFQVTRAPGKNVVYLGCLFLVIGIFAMLYIRERRLWIWVRPQADGSAQALMAMSTQRRTMDFDKEFVRLKTRLAQR
jgi:cytochrome c biogenesis protein